jgi:beta-lactamase regulating signal transducer with metallopeptidase domain
MTASLATAELFILAFAACVLVARIVCSLLAPVLLDQIDDWRPGYRYIAALFLAGAPAWLSALLFVAALSPAIVSVFVPALDHCLAHDDTHAHLCFVHLPVHAPHALLWAAFTSLLTLVAFGVAAVVWRVVRAQRVARRLIEVTAATGDGTHVLEGVEPFCAAVGLFRPKILVSRSVLLGLSDAERHALLAHERSHAQRFDALLRVVSRTLGRGYPRAIRRKLEAAIDLAAEQLCDEAAARAVGDRMIVAEAIVRIERMTTTLSPGLSAIAVNMGEAAIERRVRALLEEPASRGNTRALVAPLLVLLLVVIASAHAMHHALESTLSPLLK